MNHLDDNSPVVELAAELRRGVLGRERSLEGQAMKFYLRYVNPALAVAVLIFGLMSACLDWKPIEDEQTGETWKSIRWGGFLQDAMQTYFLAKTIFCSAALFLLGKLTEYVLVLITRPAPGAVGTDVDEPASKKGIAVASAVVVGILTLLVWQSARRMPAQARPTFTVIPAVEESDQPLDVEAARKQISLPIPDSARNVQYACFSAFLARHEIVRFEAPLDDCRKHAEIIVKQHNEEHPTSQVEGIRPLQTVGFVWPMSEGWQANWFTPQTIKHGFVAGTDGSHQPLMWIDADAGVFYYQYHD